MRVAARQKAKKTAREAVREQSRAAYQEIILEAAERIFVRRGFSGTRMSDVAREAGVATGTMYNYFEGKDELFRSLMQLRGEQFLDQIAHIYRRENDPIERIEALVRFVVEYLEERVGTCAIFFEAGVMSEMSIDCIGGDRIIEQYTEYVDLFERAFRSAARAKRLKPTGCKPGDLAAILTGMLNGLARAWIASDRSTSFAAKADLAIQVLREGVVL